MKKAVRCPYPPIEEGNCNEGDCQFLDALQTDPRWRTIWIRSMSVTTLGQVDRFYRRLEGWDLKKSQGSTSTDDVAA